MTNNLAHVVTPELVRFSYVHLLEPYAMTPGAEAKYSVMLVIPKTNKKTIKKIRDAQKYVFDQKKSEFFKGLNFNQVKQTLRDGDDLQDISGLSSTEILENCYFMNVSNKRKPQIVGTQRDTDNNFKPLNNESDEIYSGMYGRVGITFFAYSKAGNKGISASLDNVQKVKDGEHLGDVSVDANTDFAEFEDEDLDSENLIGSDDDLMG